MSKVVIDIDKINNSLVPVTNDAINKITDAVNSAQSVNFPNDEFDWTSISKDIGECLNMTNDYSNWLSNITNSYTNSVVKNLESIQTIKIEEVKCSNIVVK